MKIILWKDKKFFGKLLIETRWDIRLSSIIQETLSKAVKERERGSTVYATCGCKLPGGLPVKLYLKRNKRFIDLVSFPGHGKFHSSFCLLKKQKEEFIVESDEGLDVSTNVFLGRKKRAGRAFYELMKMLLAETEILAFNFKNAGVSRFSKLKNINAREAIPVFVRILKKIKIRGVPFLEFLAEHRLNVSCGVIYEWKELDRAVKVGGLIMYPDETKVKYREIYLPKIFVYKTKEMFPPVFFVSIFVPEKKKMLRLFLYRVEKFVPVKSESHRDMVKNFIKEAAVFVPMNRGFDRVLTREVLKKIDVGSLEMPELIVFSNRQIIFMQREKRIVIK